MPVHITNNVVYGRTVTGIPAHLSFGQFILDQLRDLDDSICLINGESGEETSRKNLLRSVVQLATGLRKRGVTRGDVVALCSENRLEVMVTALAIICCGAAVTTANLMYTDSEITHCMNISKPKLFFCSKTGLKQHIQSLKKFSYVQHIVQFDDEPPIANGVLLYKSLFEADADVNTFEPTDVKGAEDPALILYSSGTTGLPKGVMLTHVNFLYYAINGNGDGEEMQTYLTVVPWYHAYGMMGTPTFLLSGRKMVYLTAFKPEPYLKAIVKYKVQVLLVVPPIVVFLTKSPMLDECDLSSVQVMWSAAAPLSGDTIIDAMKRFPNCRGILQAYGMTETALAVTIDSSRLGHKHKIGSTGQPTPGIRLKIADLESRQRLPAYEKGEICVKGPNNMKGYMGKEQETREVFDEEGYLKTGDIGYYDSEGYLFIVDRLKELIKYKGHQVPPAEVESVLLQHSGVAECGVAGAPDADTGERTVAFVVRKPGSNVTEKEIIDFAATKLSPPKRLHGGVIFVSEVPKNPSGKILRRVLRERLRERQQSKL